MSRTLEERRRLVALIQEADELARERKYAEAAEAYFVAADLAEERELRGMAAPGVARGFRNLARRALLHDAPRYACGSALRRLVEASISPSHRSATGL